MRSDFLRFITDGKIAHYNTVHTLDVSIFIKNYVKKLSDALSKYSSLLRENNYRVENVVVGGGGISYLNGIEGAHVVEDSQFANAFGYYRYGLQYSEML